MNPKKPRPDYLPYPASSSDQRYVILFRHGLAENRLEPKADTLRRITPVGAREVCDAAHGLRCLVPRISLVVTSPLRRARETAQCLVNEFHPTHGLRVLQCLRPGGQIREASAWLRRLRCPALAVVGHEPDLSLLSAQLCGTEASAQLHLSKSGARLLQLELPGPGGARMVWQLRAQQLRDLAEETQTRAQDI